VGCTNCQGKAGCDHRKGAMLAEVDRVIAALYPTRTWGEEAPPAGPPPLGPRELAALAEALAGELRAEVIVRPGSDDEPCDFLYVLCLGRAPSVVAVRDHGVPVPAEWLALGPGEVIAEQYLRVAISHRAPLVAVQQVAIELVADAGGFAIHERPRAGVYDPPLLPRMQKLVAVVPAHGLLHVDFGEIAHAPPGYGAGPWRALYGAEPAIANYVFYPQPTTMVATTYVPGPAQIEAA
jgi:hypothetical protein